MKKLVSILSFVFVVVLANQAKAQSNLQSSKKVSYEELQAYYAQAKKVSQSNANDLRNSQNTQSGYWAWRCDSWPAVWNLWGNYYYWISDNVYYSRYRAVNACSYIVGFECLYRCYQVQL